VRLWGGRIDTNGDFKVWERSGSVGVQCIFGHMCT
jgi:hypothetical protein